MLFWSSSSQLCNLAKWAQSQVSKFQASQKYKMVYCPDTSLLSALGLYRHCEWGLSLRDDWAWLPTSGDWAWDRICSSCASAYYNMVTDWRHESGYYRLGGFTLMPRLLALSLVHCMSDALVLTILYGIMDQFVPFLSFKHQHCIDSRLFLDSACIFSIAYSTVAHKGFSWGASYHQTYCISQAILRYRHTCTWSSF